MWRAEGHFLAQFFGVMSTMGVSPTLLTLHTEEFSPLDTDDTIVPFSPLGAFYVSPSGLTPFSRRPPSSERESPALLPFSPVCKTSITVLPAENLPLVEALSAAKRAFSEKDFTAAAAHYTTLYHHTLALSPAPNLSTSLLYPLCLSLMHCGRREECFQILHDSGASPTPTPALPQFLSLTQPITAIGTVRAVSRTPGDIIAAKLCRIRGDIRTLTLTLTPSLTLTLTFTLTLKLMQASCS